MTEIDDNDTSDSVRLAELLTEAGYISQKDIDEAMQIGKETGMRVGRVLIVSGWLSENQLVAAVKAQTLVNNGKISRGAAVRALKIADEKELSFDSALQKMTATRLQALVKVDTRS
ncbi:MAG TPA: hypothetical protein EYN91_23630 [Candidatus Melainabacteria bacterium]|jgi:hypothetical protein|nr:hypothetical protein [Candidatus Obscuribacterales bacterium]PZM80614.1 MAG: hypothetical protein DKT66_15265 [Candidatus Melainabacteria bacterium]HIA55036.1 hypothetical protein [Candidatus Melainabacteria bacterium]HIN66836.1 hypothetical protein [Candidatus Obscuribacterales bacterium]